MLQITKRLLNASFERIQLETNIAIQSDPDIGLGFVSALWQYYGCSLAAAGLGLLL